MDNQLVWSDNYNIGVDIIDKEHQRLFRIINKLLAFGEEEKKGQWACLEGIKYFKEHALKHFEDEEKYMESISYRELETHRYIHKGFRDHTLPALEQELKITNYSPEAMSHFIGVCAGWLIGHTLTEDLAIVGQTISRWENRLSDKEYTAIEKTIIQLLYNMFHLESQVISQTYGGEKFGRGIYYHVVYSMEGNEEEKWEIFMAFEEQLLINTVGKIMGIKSNKLDTMLLNATRYTAQQFVRRVMKYFPSTELCEIEEENLLSYEQFQKTLEKEKTQVSLLFNTGAGYFSYSVIAPQLLQNSTINPIDTNKEIAKIEKYLMEKEQNEKEVIQKRAKAAATKTNKGNNINNTIKEIDKYFAEMEMNDKQAKTDTTNNIDTKMFELEKYFNERKTSNKEVIPKQTNTATVTIELEKTLVEKEMEERTSKPKVLVVDDSATIRQGMKELLSEDYAVSLAKSGLSAIRAITLDKPDLVLLDYEMPICNGKQILEMLRSEEEFADVPVVFLTSKTDHESVEKVIALKPEGYLSKYLKLTEIKKKIDDYFKKNLIHY
ncbi:hemerythrin domain-containing protein [Clostridium sp. MD294]|uniref:hemerythrin domain-containing protein n=1 Tax=Clostridium sp. MD294 TaxID=97138 RepID=UPI0002CC1C7D|nr:hemerythrin domain-containing protein [Clostridium sp. MD294]USF30601.1 Bacteriohemerythrin [Clostridium sp. MD294]